jgi:hypothetical protein
VFFTSPVSLGTLIVAALLLLSIVSPAFRRVREEGLQEAE